MKRWERHSRPAAPTPQPEDEGCCDVTIEPGRQWSHSFEGTVVAAGTAEHRRSPQPLQAGGVQTEVRRHRRQHRSPRTRVVATQQSESPVYVDCGNFPSRRRAVGVCERRKPAVDCREEGWRFPRAFTAEIASTISSGSTFVRSDVTAMRNSVDAFGPSSPSICRAACSSSRWRFVVIGRFRNRFPLPR
jgi:hypothetical protein